MITVEKLIPTFKKLNEVIGSAPIIPILDYALIEKETITANDLQIYLQMKFPYKGQFMLPVKQILKILTKLDKGMYVNFTPHLGGKKILMEVLQSKVYTVRSFEFTISEKVEDFPDMPPMVIDNRVLPKQELQWMQDSLSFICHDELRPAMTGVFYGEHVCATNGHYLYWRKTEGFAYDIEKVRATNEFNKKQEGIILPARAVKLMAGMENIHTGISYNSAVIFGAHDHNSDTILIVRCIDERYPDFLSVIPEEFKQVVHLDKKRFIKELDMALVVANKMTHLAELHMTSKLAKLRVSDEEESCGMETPEVGEVELLHEEIGVDAIGFNAKYMKSCIAAIQEDMVSVYISKANRAMILNKYLLIMPVMLKEHVY